jgi:hypothetical protein
MLETLAMEEVEILSMVSRAVQLVWAVDIKRRIGAVLIHFFSEVLILTTVADLVMVGINRDGTQVVEAIRIDFVTMGLARRQGMASTLICYSKQCRILSLQSQQLQNSRNRLW